jgi:uncharacterized protein YecT (DUF1311 family)
MDPLPRPLAAYPPRRAISVPGRPTAALSGAFARCAATGAFLLAGLAAGAGPARAQAGADCDPAGGRQQLNACAVRDFQAADNRLNIRYREAMEALPQDHRIALRREQREWLRARDAGCKEEARTHEGSPDWPACYHACLEKASVRRAVELGPARP